MSSDDIASAEEQRQTITALQKEEESSHVYCVAKQWYEKWQEYVSLTDDDGDGTAGKASKTEGGRKNSKTEGGGKPARTTEQTTTSQKANDGRPGELYMDTEDSEKNMFVDEKIWHRWQQWYGVSASHHLDRRNWASDERDFEICRLTPYSAFVQQPTKTFDITEETGYVEMQLRQMFKVSALSKTRLWAYDKPGPSTFRLLLERHQELGQNVTSTGACLLALEVCQGEWPTGVQGEPIGSLQRYDPAPRPRPPSYWEAELAAVVGGVFDGIASELRETVSGIVATTRYVHGENEKEAARVRERLEMRNKQASRQQRALEEKSRTLRSHEESLRAEASRLAAARKRLTAEQDALRAQIERMSELNEAHVGRVRLDVGGHVYTTSTTTLTHDPDTMLAAMFSGRHTLTREADGSYFIDRDGTHFRYILNFLRDGRFKEGALPEDPALLSELLTEAEYYQISGLVELLATALGQDTQQTVEQQKVDRKVQRKVATRK